MDFYLKRGSPFVSSGIKGTFEYLFRAYNYTSYFDTFVFNETYYNTMFIKTLDNNTFDVLSMDIEGRAYDIYSFTPRFISRKIVTKFEPRPSSEYIHIKTVGYSRALDVVEDYILTYDFIQFYYNDYNRNYFFLPVNLVVKRTTHKTEVYQDEKIIYSLARFNTHT